MADNTLYIAPIVFVVGGGKTIESKENITPKRKTITYNEKCNDNYKNAIDKEIVSKSIEIKDLYGRTLSD